MFRRNSTVTEQCTVFKPQIALQPVREGQLNIKYSKQKQELRDDPVLDGLLKTKEFVQKNNSTLLGTVIAIIVVAGGVMGVNSYRSSRQSRANDDFGKAMVAYSENRTTEAIDKFRMVSESYRGTVTATMGAYMLGSILYQQGKYDEAITWFESVTRSVGAGFINAQSYEGLAACYELKADTAAALGNLEKALADDRISYRRNAIRWKMALLTRAGSAERAIKLCDEIIADTLSREYRADAEFLKAMLNNKKAG